MESKYTMLTTEISKIADIQNAISILNWDQETYMPPKGKDFRSQQIATLSEIVHNKSTSPELEKLIDEQNLSALNEVEQRNLVLLKKDIAKSKKLPSDFVVKLSQATSSAFHSWIEARKANDFSIFEKELSNMVSLQQQKADIYGYESHPYDALMDDYEPNATVKDIDALFSDVKNQLQGLLDKIFDAEQVNDSFMYGHFDKDVQWQYGVDILKQLGYDMDAGRQDVSAHPFTTTFSPLDVRVTTRVDESNFYDMLWSCIHEGGHALYEQGLPVAQYGMPCGKAVSLGIHESQSRFYENNIGRSKAFWNANFKELKTLFPKQFEKISAAEFYKAVNIVKPSLIRTDADELTYHFHIMIRYEIEKQLIEGSLKVKDVKEAWNAAYKKYLKIDVPSDNEGVLQDVHWSHGGFGYFPTYSLGSFYAAQFYHTIEKDNPNVTKEIENKDLFNILAWLRKNIHQYGRFYDAKDLCEKATGKPLDFSYFMHYAEKKYSSIYNLK